MIANEALRNPESHRDLPRIHQVALAAILSRRSDFCGWRNSASILSSCRHYRHYLEARALLRANGAFLPSGSVRGAVFFPWWLGAVALF